MRNIRRTANSDEAAKIVVTMPRSLLRELEEIAVGMGYSRDEAFELALTQFATRERPRNDLRDRIHSAYDDYPDADEQAWSAAMKARLV